MAVARIIQTFPDSVLTFEVETDQMFTGAVEEAVDSVLRLWHEAVPDEASDS